MPFLTAGDPDLATTAALLTAAEDAGASVCELGIPFSDPIADGPVIQASMMRALDQGVRPNDVLEMVAGLRSKLKVGLVAMVSYSIVHRLGAATFLRDAAAAGIDGFIFPDLPLEACQQSGILEQVAQHGMTCSLLISPTTSDDRAQRIAQACSGFVYLLSRSGITGEKAEMAADLSPRVTRLRQATQLPIAVGFGISDPRQVHQVVAVADAAIVGSAIMRRVAEYHCQGREAVVERVGQYMQSLCDGLTRDVPAEV